MSKSGGSTNGCDEGADVHEEEPEAARRLKSCNGDSFANDEVDVGLKRRSNSGVVETIVRVQNFEDIVTVVDREPPTEDSVSVYQNFMKNNYLHRSAGKQRS